MGCEFRSIFRSCWWKGYIQCKLLSTAVGLPNLLPYYKKAGLGGHKISFLLAKSLQVTMQGEAASKIFVLKPTSNNKNEKNTKKVSKAKSKAKMVGVKKSVLNYIDFYEELWKDHQNRYNINLYSVVFDSNTNYFKFGVLKEFENPAGVFILVQTNFEPPQ